MSWNKKIIRVPRRQAWKMAQIYFIVRIYPVYRHRDICKVAGAVIAGNLHFRHFNPDRVFGSGYSGAFRAFYIHFDKRNTGVFRKAVHRYGGYGISASGA